MKNSRTYSNNESRILNRKLLIILSILSSHLSVAQANEVKSKRLEEVIVSASYREQDVQDVVGGIQVFGGQELDKKGVTGLEDYLREVPSVSLQKTGGGKSNIAIRGISNLNTLDTGYADGSPTVGVYFNDVAIQGSGVFPDLNVYDLERIEVLKGPQGTLYGEGSMGGAIKMIMTAPNSKELEAKTNLTASQTKEGGTNWDGRAAINIPLIEDEMAIRVVGTKSFDSGYIDYTSIGKEDANTEDGESLRAILTWQATEWLELEYMYLYDYSYRDQLPVVTTDSSAELENTNKEDQYAETQFVTHSLTARADLDFANLISVTSIFDTDRRSQFRVPFLAQVAFGVTESELVYDVFHTGYVRAKTDLHSISQEFRLISAGDERLDWIAGVFYRDRNQTYKQELYEEYEPGESNDPLAPVVGAAFSPASGKQNESNGREPFSQTAIYGELSYEILPSKLELTAGLRWFEDTVGFSTRAQYFGTIAAVVATNPDNVDENGNVGLGFTEELTTRDLLPKLSLAWYVNDDVMIYATASKGFRSGTPNSFSALGAGDPIVRPDYVLNKEIGAKTAWLEGDLVANMGVYEINWDDFQGLIVGQAYLGSVGPIDFPHLANAGNAVIRGAELSLLWQPTETFSAILNTGYNTGKVTEPSEKSNVMVGSEIPNKPKITVSTTLNYSRPVFNELMADVSFTVAYVDTQLTAFETEDGDDGRPLESFIISKGSLGISGDYWRAQLFVDNLADDRVVTSISIPGPLHAINRPRTIGFRLGMDY
jgi:iron complex outermembrane receptor protein